MNERSIAKGFFAALFIALWLGLIVLAFYVIGHFVIKFW